MFKTLASLRFTVFIVCCLIALFLLGLLIPQKSLLGHAAYLQWKENHEALVSLLEILRFTDIYVSPVTILLWALFFLNLFLIMARRIPLVWRRCFGQSFVTDADSLKSGRNYEEVRISGIGAVLSALKAKGYHAVSDGARFYAVKNRFSPLATLLFHFSFILILAGGILSFYTKFTAHADVAVGEEFAGEYYDVSPPKIGEIPLARFRLDDVRITFFKKKIPTRIEARLDTINGKKEIGINNPYNEGLLSFVIKHVDIAPLFILKDESGNEIDGAYVKLKFLNGRRVSFPMQEYRIESAFFPDYGGIEAAQEDERSSLPQTLKQSPQEELDLKAREIVDPAVGVEVLKNGETLNKDILMKGQSIAFDGRSLEFGGQAYWIQFYVVKEHGLGIVYTGFVLMIIALVMRLLFFRRDIRGVYEEGTLRISGSSDFYPGHFSEEFRGITGSLTG
ncbi:MAG: cytochrome c biogenesis protein ResB [Nitrospirae bacterium]|nr:cytochrome c biogenesis protein ResB [Nitrospirota bacterium]